MGKTFPGRPALVRCKYLLFFIVAVVEAAQKIDMGGGSVSGHEKMPQTFSISAALARKQKWTVSCRHRPFSVLLFPCLRPHAGGDPYRPPGSTHPSYFDPRPPVRGGDLVEAGLLYPSSDFNPRPPCRGRHDGWSLPGLTVEISIHAPRAGGDELCLLQP